MDEPLISVIVPIYNVEKYLNRCIESIVNQTYKTLEIILVDDGSPDNCPQICDEWKEKDNRIKVIHKKNGGLSDARNAGLDIAQGEYIAFVDSDDWIDKEWIEILFKELIKNNCDVSISSTRLFKNVDETLFIRGNTKKFLTNIEALEELINEKNIFTTACDKLYKKELIINYHFEKNKVNEDEFWTWKVLLSSKRVVCCGKPNYNYLQNEDSIMGRKYSIKRIDGLSARLERFLKLKEYKSLSSLCNQKLIWDCIFHMQCTYTYLEGNDKKKAIEYIKEVIRYIDFSKITYKSKKECIWINMFRISPKLTAIIRNKLRIGF